MKIVNKMPKTHRSPLSAKSRACPAPSTLAEQMPALDAVFVGLAHGETPDVLQMMTAISEMVAFHTKCDSNSECNEIEQILMSQNKCRFCS